MLRVQDAVLVLACRVDNLGRKVLALVLDHLAKRVLDRGVVAVDEVAVHEPHRQRRLACLIHLCQLCLHPTLAEANSNIERGDQYGSILTDRAAADNGDLSLLGGRHGGTASCRDRTRRARE
jgi:hypothetical protein